MKLTILIVLIELARGNKIKLYQDYFSYKNIKYVCYFSCKNHFENIQVVRALSQKTIRFSVIQVDNNVNTSIEKAVYHWTTRVGIIADGNCEHTPSVLQQASKSKLFDAAHAWLVITPAHYNSTDFLEEYFRHLNLSIDADLAVVSNYESGYTLTDVFNFGKIQGGELKIASLGSWQPDHGLNISLMGCTFYRRWNFHNLTLRAISVISDKPEGLKPQRLDDSYTVAATTKITSQLLNILKDLHNVRFNYTLADRWTGSPQRNSTLAVTNALYWEEQDLCSTCTRVFPQWLEWVDICFSPITKLQTKFYYLMLEKGVGPFENRFLSPMSAGAWWSAAGAAAACAAVLAAGAALEGRNHPALHAFFSAVAALFQQGFDDGEQETRTSEGRKLALVVAGVTSMLVYSYYTSSTTSRLLSAAPPALASLHRLAESDYELVFEDTGYTRGWLDNPGFSYYNGFADPAEDRLREVKVTKAKRTVSPLQPVDVGIQLVRTGKYAFHTEPYTASQVISRAFTDKELCALGELQVMRPAPVYIMLQRRSPYKEFLVWSMLRLSERGHMTAWRRRFSDRIPECSQRKPHAIALGQVAPAFLVLLQLIILSVVILLVERTWHRFHPRGRQAGRQTGGSLDGI